MDKKLQALINTKLHIRAEKGVIDEEKQLLVGVVGSSGIIDRQGESLNPQGWILDAYMKDPVILWAHDYRALPIGKAERVWIENGKLMFNIKFADTAFAKDVFDLFKGGFLNAFSVGFIPKELDSTGEYTWAKQELLELSAVPVPANPEALLNDKTMSAKMKSIEDALKKEGKELPHEKQGRVLSTKNEGKLRQADTLLNEVLGELEKDTDKGVDEDADRIFVLTEADLKAVIKSAVAEAMAGLTVIQEKIVEKIVEVEKKENGDKPSDFLLSLRNGLREQDKSVGLMLKSLNEQLKIKSSQKGGDTK